LERPRPEPPLDVTPFLELIDDKVYACRSGNIADAGTSTTAVLLIFGPDAGEVAAVKAWLNAAFFDQIRWQRAATFTRRRAKGAAGRQCFASASPGRAQDPPAGVRLAAPPELRAMGK
jgi:hypothetical protein